MKRIHLEIATIMEQQDIRTNICLIQLKNQVKHKRMPIRTNIKPKWDSKWWNQIRWKTCSSKDTDSCSKNTTLMLISLHRPLPHNKTLQMAVNKQDPCSKPQLWGPGTTMQTRCSIRCRWSRSHLSTSNAPRMGLTQCPSRSSNPNIKSLKWLAHPTPNTPTWQQAHKCCTTKVLSISFGTGKETMCGINRESTKLRTRRYLKVIIK